MRWVMGSEVIHRNPPCLEFPRLAFAGNQDLNSGLGACTQSSTLISLSAIYCLPHAPPSLGFFLSLLVGLTGPCTQ